MWTEKGTLAVAKIPLRQGVYTLVDDADLAYIVSHRWYATKHRWTTYATAKIGRTTIYMHRLLLDAPKGFQVDHINGDGLDNRRINLRLATASQQAANSRPKHKRAQRASHYKGIYWHSWRTGGCWRAELDTRAVGGGRKRFILYASTEEEAAKLYDQLARKHFGAFAKPNFP